MTDSIYDRGRRLAEEYRRSHPDAAGRDPGPAAEREWYAREWPGFVRACLVEHLWGRRAWAEFPAADFGSVPKAVPTHIRLVDEVAAKLAAGADNLTVLTWAVQHNHPVPVVGRILAAADVSRCLRFPPPDDEGDAPYIVLGPGSPPA